MLHIDTVVVGAGISGLTLARRLKEQDRIFKIIEKSRGVGGRMATRRDGLAAFDHGAQFYKTGRTADLPFDHEFSRQNLAQIWFVKDGRVFKAASGGITQLAKSLAQGLDILLNHQLKRIQRGQATTLELEMLDGQILSTEQLFLTCPLPQSLKILADSKIEYPRYLDDIHFAKALVGLFEVETESPLVNGITYQQPASGKIFSIANQQSKKVSQSLAFTVTMHPDWSDQNFEANEDSTTNEIQGTFENHLKQSGAEAFKITKATLKKWRYSHPLTKPNVLFEKIGNITLLGDAFGGGSLGGAAASAMAVDLGPTTDGPSEH
jgi:renalase